MVRCQWPKRSIKKCVAPDKLFKKVRGEVNRGGEKDMNNCKYDEELIRILKDYNLYEREFSSDGKKIKSILIKELKKRCLHRRIGLWGVGQTTNQKSHASVILNDYACEFDGEIVCIIDGYDMLWGQNIDGVPIVSPKDIKQQDIDMIIITSKNSVQSIVKDIEKYAPKCEYFDIYGVLRENGITVYHEFFREASAYTMAYTLRKQYEEAKSEDEKIKNLTELIKIYAYLRDFHYLFYFMDIYMKKEYEGWKQIQNCKKEIENLLEQVKLRSVKNSEQDMLVFCIDALSGEYVYGDTEENRVLKSYTEKAYNFTNLYSTAPTTYESFTSIIAGRYPFDQDVYEGKQTFYLKESTFLSEVRNKGYAIHFYTDGEYSVIEEEGLENVEYFYYPYLAQKNWYMLCDMAENDKPTLFYAYTPFEMHIPHICGYHSNEPVSFALADIGVIDINSFVETQLNDAKKYVDIEMGEFQQFISEDMRVAIFSDHSQIGFDREEMKPYYMYYNDIARNTHATLFVMGKGIEHGVHKEDVSLIHLNDILIHFFLDEKHKIPSEDIMQIQYYPIKSKGLRDVAKVKGYTDYIDGIRCFLGKDYLYVRTGTKKEELYRRGETKHNLISQKQGEDFVRRIKQRFCLE